MKVLFVSHEYFNRRLKYADTMESLGAKVRLVRIQNKKSGAPVPLKYLKDIDLVFCLTSAYVDSGIISHEFIQHCHENGIRLACYGTSSMSVEGTEWVDTYMGFSHAFLQNKVMIEFFNWHRPLNGIFHYMPLGYHPSQYYLPKKLQKKTIDVNFMGSPQTLVDPADDKRVHALKHLIDAGINVEVYGKKLCERMHQQTREFRTHDEQRDVYWKSKVTLDLPWMNTNLPEWKDVSHQKNRLYEAPASGSFLVTGDSLEVRALFKGCDGIFFYNPNKLDHMVKVVKSALEVEERMSKYQPDVYWNLLKKQSKYMKDQHSFHHRFKSMFQTMGF